MVFGLFTSKPTLDNPSESSEPKTDCQPQNARLPTPTPTSSTTSVAHRSHLRFPTFLLPVLGGSAADSALKDPVLPIGSVVEDKAKVLYDLMLTVPPKTLHAYTLAHLSPQPPLPSTSASSPAPISPPDNTPCPPSPNTVTKLTSFFSTLAPPPSLHCVRCHKDFYDIENEEKDKACRVPHDDESALVSRVSGGGYETLWGCCGQTASGDGSEGPPDGWCYEGRHTTDIKRARFRADSTIHDDKLTSCLKLNCRGVRSQLPRYASHPSPSRNAEPSSARKYHPSPARSQASVLISHPTRKRPRKSPKETSGSDSEADAENPNVKDKVKSGRGAREGGEDASMGVDEPNRPPKSKGKDKSQLIPISRGRPPLSTSTTVSPPTSGSNITLAVSSRAQTTAAKPKPASRTLLSQTYTHPASDSEASSRSHPRTRSRVREESRGRDASRTRTSKLTRAGISERARRTNNATKSLSRMATSEGQWEAETDEYRESDREERGRDRKKRRVGRN